MSDTFFPRHTINKHSSLQPLSTDVSVNTDTVFNMEVEETAIKMLKKNKVDDDRQEKQINGDYPAFQKSNKNFEVPNSQLC